MYTMMCVLIVAVFVISATAAPYMPISGQLPNQLDQSMMNQIAQQSMEQWILQNQYYSMRQQMMALQNLEAMKKTQHGLVPSSLSIPQQPFIILMPNTIARTTTRNENYNEINNPNLKFGNGDADTIVITAENKPNILKIGMVPQESVVVMPNGQRLIIGSIISAIPFLPFEVNVPATIGWIYNGIAGIIGGLGQRLPFIPKPTTEPPVQGPESTPATQVAMTQDEESVMLTQVEEVSSQDASSRFMQKLMSRKPNAGMPILMLPLAHAVPIQLPIQESESRMGSGQSVRATHFSRPEPPAQEEKDPHISITNKMVERLVEDATLAGGAASAEPVTKKPARDDLKDKILMEKMKCLDETHSERSKLTMDDLNSLVRRIEMRSSTMPNIDPVCEEFQHRVIECYNQGEDGGDVVQCWGTIGEFSDCVAATGAARRAQSLTAAEPPGKRTSQYTHSLYSVRDSRRGTQP